MVRFNCCSFRNKIALTATVNIFGYCKQLSAPSEVLQTFMKLCSVLHCNEVHAKQLFLQNAILIMQFSNHTFFHTYLSKDETKLIKFLNICSKEKNNETSWENSLIFGYERLLKKNKIFYVFFF